jgi:molybdopterin-guanine dinucleotide biosynthesis protein B
MKPAIIRIIGRSNSGKTSLIEKLIAHYRGLGIRAAAVKNLHHSFETDIPGKDSRRYREAGAEGSAITNGKETAVFISAEIGADPYNIALRYFSDFDIVFIEGDKNGQGPKIETIVALAEEPLYRSGAKGIIALVCDKSQDTDLPLFKHNDIIGIADALKSIIS